MYEQVTEEWMRYTARLGTVLPQDDVRFLVSAEAHTRLGQLDLILSKIAEGLRPTPDNGMGHEPFLAAWDWVSVYTDAFYFFAWRLIDLLNDGGGEGFPYLEAIEARGVMDVRAEMLAHPERQGDYFRHGLELRDELLGKIVKGIEALEGDAGR